MTKQITTALYLIGIQLVDHMIFAGREAYSMVRGRLMGSAQEDASFSYVVSAADKRGGGLKDEEYEWVSLAPEGIE